MKVLIKFWIQSVLVMNLEEEGRFICGCCITCVFVNKWRYEDADSAEVMYQAKLLLKNFFSKLEEVMKYHTKQS